MSSVDSRQLSDPASELPDRVAAMCADLLSGIWTEGTRHFITVHVAGWCLHCGYPEAAARRLIAKVCEIQGDGGIDERLKAVSDTYAKASSRPSADALRDVLRESIPKVLAALPHDARKLIEAKALRVFDILRMPPAARKINLLGRRLPDFRIIKIVKFTNTKPVLMNVTFEKDGDPHLFVGDVNTFFSYARFQKAVYEQLDIMLADIDERVWHRMISYHPAEKREAPGDDRREGKP